MDIPKFVYSPVDGYLSCFQFGAIVNKAAINTKTDSVFGLGTLDSQPKFLSIPFPGAQTGTVKLFANITTPLSHVPDCSWFL